MYYFVKTDSALQRAYKDEQNEKKDNYKDIDGRDFDGLIRKDERSHLLRLER